MNHSGLQFEIISESFIKPSSPTPPLLRCYKLSFMDQIAPVSYPSLAFFYPGIQCSELSQMLQNSLSKTLCYYYPFAGRLTNNLFIDCNDMGVEFIEVRIHCEMSDIMEQQNSQLKDLILPAQTVTDGANIPADRSLVLVQLNYFDCGSLAISMIVSHKIADMAAVSAFINHWAAIARLSCDPDHFPSLSDPPLFIGASLFPPVEDPGFYRPTVLRNQSTRRFLFQASKVAELKAMAANSEVDNPTRYEVVTALLHKCAMSAAKANSGSFRPSLLFNAIIHCHNILLAISVVQLSLQWPRRMR